MIDSMFKLITIAADHYWMRMKITVFTNQLREVIKIKLILNTLMIPILNLEIELKTLMIIITASK